MKNKQIFLRFIIGFACGILQGAMVMFFISIGVNGIKGEYIPVLPSTVRLFCSENLAVIMQTVLTGLLGAAYAMASFVYENPKWSFLKQSLMQFLITFPCILVVAAVCWVPVEKVGYISLAGSVFAGYIINFIIQLNVAKSNVKAINDKMEEYVKSLEDNNDSN